MRFMQLCQIGAVISCIVSPVLYFHVHDKFEPTYFWFWMVGAFLTVMSIMWG